MRKRRYQCAAHRDLIRAVLAAGGTYTMSTRGHMKVTGPKGIAVVGARFNGIHGLGNAVATIRRYSGLRIAL